MVDVCGRGVVSDATIDATFAGDVVVVVVVVDVPENVDADEDVNEDEGDMAPVAENACRLKGVAACTPPKNCPPPSPLIT